MRTNLSQITLTNSSGALVPSETTVKPITSCGIPKIRESDAAPWTKNSPPAKRVKIPIMISSKDCISSVDICRETRKKIALVWLDI